VVARASALFLLVQSGDQEFAHVRSKIGRVHGNDLGLFLEEKHLCGCQRLKVNSLGESTGSVGGAGAKGVCVDTE
jgi:hypothetical protein